MRKCEYCGSIWVCWNWFYQTKEKLQELNPNQFIYSDCYGHECWDCSGVQETGIRVTDGIPYFILRNFYKYFKKIKK